MRLRNRHYRPDPTRAARSYDMVRSLSNSMASRTAPPIVDGMYLLLEDGFFLFLEDSSKIKLENP